MSEKAAEVNQNNKTSTNIFTGVTVFAVIIFSALTIIQLMSASNSSTSSSSSSYNVFGDHGVSELTWCVPVDCTVLEADWTTKLADKRSHEFISDKNDMYSLSFCKQHQQQIKVTEDRNVFAEETYKALLERRKMCEFEHKAIKQAVGNERIAGIQFFLGAGFPIYHSYNLLVSAIISNQINTHEAGFWLDFGVEEGKAANITTEAFRSRGNLHQIKLHGFDTVKGLMKRAKKGSRELPALYLKQEFKLHVGNFDKTLSSFLKKSNMTLGSAPKDKNILAGVNIDTNNMDDSMFILKKLVPYMRVGTVLHFHEIFSPMPSKNPMDSVYVLHNFLHENKLSMDMLPVRSQEHQAGIFVITSIRH